jgi:hypothetical protein
MDRKPFPHFAAGMYKIHLEALDESRLMLITR